MAKADEFPKGRIGIVFQEPSAAQALDMIRRAESLGVPGSWVSTGGAGPDGLTLLAAAAAQTKAIRLGTAIVPTFPRHPLVVAQQAEVIANLAPGRLVVGVGPSHKSTVESDFGIPFERPLEHLREYVAVLKGALHEGTVSFDGARFHVHGQLPLPSPVPVMVSALRSHSFRLAGAVADGAITWICPAPYIRDVGLPALRQGATEAHRAAPPLIAHCYVALCDDQAEVARVARGRLGRHLLRPFYREMLAAAGYPEARQGVWSDAMLDAVVVQGDEDAVAEGLRSFGATAGASELMISILPTGADQRGTAERAMLLVAGM